MMVESQFANTKMIKPKRSRKLRKNYTVIQEPPRVAKGAFKVRKSAGFRATRYPVYLGNDTNEATLERAMWLQ